MPPLTAANHAIRAGNVTASEVGALLGEHPYMTPGRIWDRLVGGIDHGSEQSLAMEFGSRVEPILQDFSTRAIRDHYSLVFEPGSWKLFGESLTPVLRLNSRTYQHRRVRLCATPDAMILNTRRSGESRGGSLVEFKLSFSRDRWRDGLPKDIEWQVRAQMACTRRERVYVYVFSGVGKLYVVDRSHWKEQQMTQAVEAFFRDHVDTGIRPADPIQSEIVYRKRAS